MSWRRPDQAQTDTYKQRMLELYQRLKTQREQERKDAIRDGFLADPDRPRKLKDAITPKGTCQDMCPQFERVERIVQKMVDGMEKVRNGRKTHRRWIPGGRRRADLRVME